jgi:hypothetical protein
MNDNQNVAIGVLSVTAVILLVGLVLMGSLGSQQAQAGSQHDRGGDYVMLTSQWRPDQNLLWILDARNEVIVAYWFDKLKVRFDLVGVEAIGPR